MSPITVAPKRIDARISPSSQLLNEKNTGRTLAVASAVERESARTHRVIRARPCSAVLGGEPLPQPPRALEQVLGQHLHLTDDRHEARVAVPARDDVEVHVVLDAGARHAAQIPAEVEAMRAVLLAQCLDGARREAVDLLYLVR